MVENPKSAVPAQYKSTLDSRIKKYPKIIKIMLLFGGQNLPINRISPAIADQEINGAPGNFVLF